MPSARIEVAVIAGKHAHLGEFVCAGLRLAGDRNLDAGDRQSHHGAAVSRSRYRGVPAVATQFSGIG
jgi:hypothetical protein